MRIGELSERTGASRRLLRYYEEQGLITADRRPNGYRDYDERLVDRVLQIRGLLESGLPTRMIKKILPCLTVPGILYCPEDATPEMIAALQTESDRLTERIQFLTRNRDAITDYIQAARRNNGTGPSAGGRLVCERDDAARRWGCAKKLQPERLAVATSPAD
jgi:DNA-binding transcriptional MerR regulator